MSKETQMSFPQAKHVGNDSLIVRTYLKIDLNKKSCPHVVSGHPKPPEKTGFQLSRE